MAHHSFGRHRGDEDNMECLCESSWYHRCWNFRNVLSELKRGSLESICCSDWGWEITSISQIRLVYHFLSNNYVKYNSTMQERKNFILSGSRNLLVCSWGWLHQWLRGMQWRPTNPIWYSLDINLRGGPYNRWWHTILLGDTEEMRTTWSVYVNHRGTTDAGTLEMCCRSWSEAHLSLSVVVIEAEKSLVLVKSD